MNTPELKKVVSIPFSTDEARVMLQLIDAAVKALGLNGAEAGYILSKKINDAFAATEVPKSE